MESVADPETNGRGELQMERDAPGLDGCGEGWPGGVAGSGSHDVEEAGDGGGGLVGLVPAGREGRSGGDQRVVEVDGGVHGVVVDADVAVGVAIAYVEGEAGAGRAEGRVEAAGDGEGGNVEAGAVRAQAEPEHKEDDDGNKEEAQEEGAEGVGKDGGAALPGAPGDAPHHRCRRSWLSALVHAAHHRYKYKSSSAGCSSIYQVLLSSLWKETQRIDHYTS